jgi:hypothetical protein
LSAANAANSAAQFVESVLSLKPSIAVFDCDGTLWSGDAGADFFYWEIEHGIVSRETGEWAHARYEEYKAGRVGEEETAARWSVLTAASRTKFCSAPPANFSTR